MREGFVSCCQVSATQVEQYRQIAIATRCTCGQFDNDSKSGCIAAGASSEISEIIKNINSATCTNNNF